MDATGPSVVVTVGGDLDYPCADALRDALDEVLRSGANAITIDVGPLTFIDSTGLAVLVHAWRNGLEAGIPVRLRHQPPFLVTVLDFTGVGELLERPLPAAGAESATA